MSRTIEPGTSNFQGLYSYVTIVVILETSTNTISLKNKTPEQV